MSRVDFTNPFVVARWLRCLEPKSSCGYLIKPNLSLPKRVLGFSFSSNSVGLRGPENVGASQTILGTSYAMGFGVNSGENWHDLLLSPDRWFNCGLPVGPEEWIRILDEKYRGSYERALFIYHPNVLQHAVTYLKWRQSNKTLFEFMNWKSGRMECLRLWIKRRLQYRRRLADGTVAYVSGVRCNAHYARVNLEKDAELVSTSVARIGALLKRFRSVTVVKVPIKEHLAALQPSARPFQELAQEFENYWQVCAQGWIDHPDVRVVEAPLFAAEDYNPLDTHWSATGNRKFTEWLPGAVSGFEM